MNTISVTTPSTTELSEAHVQRPKALVFAAHTEAEHLRHWWGRGNPLDVTIDFRVGGTWRFVEKTGDEQHAFRGESASSRRRTRSPGRSNTSRWPATS